MVCKCSDRSKRFAWLPRDMDQMQRAKQVQQVRPDRAGAMGPCTGLQSSGRQGPSP